MPSRTSSSTSLIEASKSITQGPHQPTSREVAWLRRCLPVFYQPQCDVDNANELIKIYFRFERDDMDGSLKCKLCIVFAGEASYNRIKETAQNAFATLLYRTFNRRTYKRTADINYMEYRHVDLDPDSTVPWQSIFTTDHSGDQRWSQGAKRDVLNWFSLMHHYKHNVEYSEWTKVADTHRPKLYLNTCNHMIGQVDNNPDLEKCEWKNYPFELGGEDDAFIYVVEHVPTKFNLYSYVCCWSARNGGGCCDRFVHHPNKMLKKDEWALYFDEDHPVRRLSASISNTFSKTLQAVQGHSAKSECTQV